MYKRLAHVGIAVRNLDHSSGVFSKLFGTAPEHTEEVPDQKVKAAFFSTGESGIELLEPTSLESPIGKFLEKKGEGVHHLSFEVDDLEGEMARLTSEGFQLVDQEPRGGAGGFRVAFLHPKSTNGVLIELSEKKKE